MYIQKWPMGNQFKRWKQGNIWAETSDASQCGGNRLHRVSWVKSLNKQMTKHKIRTTRSRNGQVNVQSCYSIVSEITSFQLKIMRYADKKENMAHIQGDSKNCPWGNTDVGLNRQNNVFKATLNIFKELKEIISKILKERRTISHQIENIS